MIGHVPASIAKKELPTNGRILFHKRLTYLGNSFKIAKRSAEVHLDLTLETAFCATTCPGRSSLTAAAYLKSGADFSGKSG